MTLVVWKRKTSSPIRGLALWLFFLLRPPVAATNSCGFGEISSNFPLSGRTSAVSAHHLPTSEHHVRHAGQSEPPRRLQVAPVVSRFQITKQVIRNMERMSHLHARSALNFDQRFKRHIARGRTRSTPGRTNRQRSPYSSIIELVSVSMRLGDGNNSSLSSTATWLQQT